MFDPGPEDRMGVMLKLVRALDSNRCDVRCQVVTSLFIQQCICPPLVCSMSSNCS